MCALARTRARAHARTHVKQSAEFKTHRDEKKTLQALDDTWRVVVLSFDGVMDFVVGCFKSLHESKTFLSK